MHFSNNYFYSVNEIPYALFIFLYDVQVGRDGEAEPFLAWTNPEPILITHFGVRTSWGADGHWRIDGT